MEEADEHVEVTLRLFVPILIAKVSQLLNLDALALDLLGKGLQEAQSSVDKEGAKCVDRVGWLSKLLPPAPLGLLRFRGVHEFGAETQNHSPARKLSLALAHLIKQPLQSELFF